MIRASAESPEEARRRLAILGWSQAPPALTWKQRISVMCDATRGLLYLHSAEQGR